MMIRFKRLIACGLAFGLFAATAKAEEALPTGYVQIDYIKSTGSQYIDTGVTAASDLKAELDYVPHEQEGDGSFGTFKDDAADWRFAPHRDGCFFDCGKARLGLTSNAAKLQAGTRYIVKVGYDGASASLYSDVCNASGTLLSHLTGSVNGEPHSVNIYLFGVNNESGATCTKMRVYSFKLRNNGTLVRDFVPARRLSDGMLGLLNLAQTGETFYPKLGGGSFTAGDAVGMRHYGAACGELHVDVASGEIENMTAALTGTLKLVKEGAGTLSVANGQSFSGGTEVKEGTLQYAASDFGFGSPGSACTVRSGATLDFNGYGMHHNQNPIVLDGGTILSTADRGNTAQDWVSRFTLTDDSFICGHGFGFVGKGYAENFLELNGHTLAISIDTAAFFYMANLTVTGGGEITVDGVDGSYLITGGNEDGEGKYVHAPTTRLRVVGASIRGRQHENNYTDVTFLDYVSEYTGDKDMNPTRWISVTGRFRPGVKWHSTSLVPGATIDLSDQTGAWTPPCSFPSTTGSGKVRWSAGEYLIDLGARTDSGEKGKIVSWTAKPEGVTFKLAPTTQNKGVIRVEDDGIYIKRGLIITIR